MNELLRIKSLVEAQISATKEMIEDDKSRMTEKSIYLKNHIKELEIKIEAWDQTLKLVEERIGLLEIELEELEIFKPNNYETYFG